MNSTTADLRAPPTASLPPRAPCCNCCSACSTVSLTLQQPDGTLRHFGPGGSPAAAITLRNWNVCSAALRSGDIGFAESYIAGDWTTPHLTDLLQLFIANRHQVDSMVYGSWAGRLLYRVRHLLHRNTRAGSQKTSTRTTTWAMRSTGSGWTTP